MPGRISIAVRFELPIHCRKDDDLWIETKWVVPGGSCAKIADVRKRIYSEVKDRLEHDEWLRSYLIKNEIELRFQTSFQVVGYGRGLVDIESGNVRVGTIGDLFLEPDVASELMIGVYDWRDPHGCEYVRLGDEVRDDGHRFDLDNPIGRAVVGRINLATKGSNRAAMLLADFYDFGDGNLVGPGDISQETVVDHNDPDVCTIDPEYYHIDSGIMLRQLNEKYTNNEIDYDLDFQVPKLPSMTFNTFIPRPAENLPREVLNINIAVRWVDRLQPSGSQSLLFPRNLHYQTVSSYTDTYYYVYRWLLDNLKTHTTELFTKPLAGTWELEIWVRAQAVQKLDPRTWKMFRYPTGHPDSDNTLHQFLSRQCTDRDNWNSYMEAHVVKKESAGDSADSTTHTSRDSVLYPRGREENDGWSNVWE